jgi:hypothetical protein
VRNKTAWKEVGVNSLAITHPNNGMLSLVILNGGENITGTRVELIVTKQKKNRETYIYT